MNLVSRRIARRGVELKTDYPIILVLGFFDSPSIFNSMKKTLEGEGYTVFVPPLTPSSGRLGIPYLAEQLKDYIHTHLPSDQRFHLLGYSMGGLISRYYVQRLGGLDRVEEFITISTPHHGTRTAHFVWNEGGKQMRPNSDFLKELNRDVDRLSSVRFTSIWTLWDLTIIPSHSSVISFAKNVRLHVVAHLWMVFSGRVKTEVLRVLRNQKSEIRNQKTDNRQLKTSSSH